MIPPGQLECADGVVWYWNVDPIKFRAEEIASCRQDREGGFG
jgi:hypothetical protein